MGSGSWVALTATFIAVSAVFIYLAQKKIITLVDPEKKYSLPLIAKEVISRDTVKFRFGLPSEEHVLGLPVGKHIHLTAKVHGKLVVRPYTPISSDDDKGYVELLVKIYRANQHPKFPEGGKMTQYLDTLSIGDKIDFRGPSGLIEYKGHGVFETKKKKTDTPTKQAYSKIGMIAGGSGITPMLQIIRAILEDDTDDTVVFLLFANQSEEDILLKNEIDKYARENPSKLNIWYTVDRPPANWSYSSGFINEDMIKNHFPPPSDDLVILLCGPPPMINFACMPNLDKLGYAAETRLIF
ncbi:unnamed protein product [Enterobius vermicularis]|uniref:NADH-cytochrome b5 reductase n=1 Tax=Enterobius vermicularis TaxID=51028 RepID=A0A0N4VEF5_ENTVE|nr:unnamed protein product [Enterobius vermicularis]